MERILAHELRDLAVEVVSMGTGALVGQPIDPESVALLRARGVDAENFAARMITADAVLACDLILTATREHRAQVVRLAPGALRKTHALLDFADLIADLDGPVPPNVGGSNGIERLIRYAESQRTRVPARSQEDAALVDPYRRGSAVFQQMQAAADPALRIVAERIRTALTA